MVRYRDITWLPQGEQLRRVEEVFTESRCLTLRARAEWCC